MWRLEKVIFDTNRLYNSKLTTFFAKNVCWLESFHKSSEIIIPTIVLEELRNKYKRDFQEGKEKFFQNMLSNILSHNAETIDIDDKIQKLLDTETITFSQIELTNMNVLSEMIELALKKEPPFEAWKGTDKWFKDACLYFTILEYLNTLSDKYIFVCTCDWRLKEALEKHKNIIVVEDFKEFESKSTWYFKEKYFIDKLNEILPHTVDSIWDIQYNINDNWLITIITNDIDTYRVEVDFSTKEIIDFVRKWDFNDLINWLISSDNFSDTHSIIKQLMWFINYITDDEIISLYNALFTNSQIRWAFWYSVKEFYLKLYENKTDLFDDEMKNKIDKLFE